MKSLKAISDLKRNFRRVPQWPPLMAKRAFCKHKNDLRRC